MSDGLCPRPREPSAATLHPMHPAVAVGHAIRLHRRGASPDALAAILALLHRHYRAGDAASGLVASWLIGKRS